MSEVTTTPSNAQLIELAKQQYEKQQFSKVPGYIVNLPSGGKIYPETSKLRLGQVEMRHMTSFHEDILSNMSYIREGIVYEKLIENLLVTPGVNVHDLSMQDLEYLIVSARIYGYGKIYPVTVTDPETSHQIKRDIDLSEIEFKPFNIQSDEAGEFDYIRPDTNQTIKFKYLTIPDAKKISDESTVSDFLKLSIQSIDGNRDKQFINDYIKFEFIAKQSKDFRKYIADNAYGVDYNITFEGENGSTFQSKFQIGGELFWD